MTDLAAELGAALEERPPALLADGGVSGSAMTRARRACEAFETGK